MTKKQYFVTHSAGCVHCGSISRELEDGSFEELSYQDIVDRLNENEQLKELVDYADDLIHSHLSEHFIRQWTNFKMSHKEYAFWEETLKKYNELNDGDVE